MHEKPYRERGGPKKAILDVRLLKKVFQNSQEISLFFMNCSFKFYQFPVYFCSVGLKDTSRSKIPIILST